MNTKHTPGPWDVEIDERIDERGLYYVAGYNIHSREDGAVVGIEGICCGPRDEANARLIAAAPELLAACAGLLDALRTSGVSNGAIRFAEDQARAAIAKAEGRA